MHIAIVRKSFSLKKAGAERYSVNLSRQLQKLGHQVTVIGAEIDPELRDEVEFLPVTYSDTTSWAKNSSFSINAGKVAKSRPFDIVHGLSRAASLDTFRLTDPLQAHWFHVYYRHPVNNFLQGFNPRHRMLFSLERSIYQSANVRRIITQSKLDSELIQKYYGVPAERIRRVYNGVDTSVFHPGVRENRDLLRAKMGIGDEPVLVFASMDFRRKGLDGLLHALARVDHVKAKLMILGNGQIPHYHRLAAKLGLGGRVLFLGRQQAIERYYGAGDLFVLPTIYEPFPNVNLEAMACGLPVLTSATAGGADIVRPGENGYVVPNPHDVEVMVEHINQHFQKSQFELEAMSQACWKTAQGMTLESNARQTLSVFEEVLNERCAA